MNGIEKITARIEAEARSDAEAAMSAAREECEQIETRYAAEAQEEYWKIIRAGTRETELRVQRLGSTAEMEAKKSILAMKQEMVARTFERAIELVCGLPEEDYTQFLAKTAAAAARSGEEEIILNMRDNSAYGRNVQKVANDILKERGVTAKLKISDKVRNIRGGLILKDGDIETNCSVELLVDLRKNEMAAQVADVIFQS